MARVHGTNSSSLLRISLSAGRDVDTILSFYKNLAKRAEDNKGKLKLETFRLQLAYVAFKKVVKACELD